MRFIHNNNSKKSLIQLLEVAISGFTKHHRARYGFEDMISFTLVISSEDPLSYRDATNKKTMKNETLQENKTWELVKLPK